MSKTTELNAAVANLNDKAEAIIAKLNNPGESTPDAEVETAVANINTISDKLNAATNP